MGTGRSLVELLRKYTENNQDSPPTQSEGTLKQWSSNFNWSHRAVEYDANYEQLKNDQRKAVMEYGAALDFDRVARLKRLANFLESQIYETGENGEFHNVWNPDKKSIGPAPFNEIVEIERFNSALISEYRSTLDDIAKEVGGRVKKQEHTGADGGDLVFKLVYPDSD